MLIAGYRALTSSCLIIGETKLELYSYVLVKRDIRFSHLELEIKLNYLEQLLIDPIYMSLEHLMMTYTRTFYRKIENCSFFTVAKEKYIYKPFFFRYTRNGLLHMLDRNRRIKPCPEKFQNTTEQFNLIITCEERVYDQVIECNGVTYRRWISSY